MQDCFKIYSMMLAASKCCKMTSRRTGSIMIQLFLSSSWKNERKHTQNASISPTGKVFFFFINTWINSFDPFNRFTLLFYSAFRFKVTLETITAAECEGRKVPVWTFASGSVWSPLSIFNSTKWLMRSQPPTRHELCLMYCNVTLSLRLLYWLLNYLFLVWIMCSASPCFGEE